MSQQAVTQVSLNQLPLQTKLQLIASAKEETEILQHNIESIKRRVRDITLVDAARHVAPLKPLRPREVRQFKGHTGKIQNIRLAGADKALISIASDGFLLVWDVYTGLKTHAIQLPISCPQALGTSRSGHSLAVGGLDNVVSIYSIESIDDQYLSSTQEEFPESITEYLTDDQLLSGSGDMSVKLWDLKTGQKVYDFVDRNLSDVTSLCCHPYFPNVFLSASLNTVKVWDTRHKYSLQSFSENNAEVNSIKLFPDGNAVVAGCENSSLRIFDLRSDCMVGTYTLAPHSARATSPSSMPSYSPISPASVHSPYKNNIYNNSQQQYHQQQPAVCAMAFSPSGRLLFTSYEDGTWGAWDSLKFTWMGPFSPGDGDDGGGNGGGGTRFTAALLGNHNNYHNHSGQVSDIQVTSDGSRIYTSNWDSIIRVYTT
ncbi:uncharacterized protein SAPINGB_P001942 [Magnusiomyces paraingens]|uniref:Anaphase-promoting complex subunit 4 WD40 domain-containing protein n=1 Tax=Magnusiomyces paraingens TaxID=2606893 RepID=A0A5E8BDK1_9ASCO|nr:uncharacterized protein SAPINGB_P001942 [Saprochaete ingens]VVT48769.1 unnamed protein product [Saprochaete ingens]